MRSAILFSVLSLALCTAAHARGQFIALQTPNLQITKISGNGLYAVGSNGSIGVRYVASTGTEQFVPGLDVALGINNFGTISGAVPVNGGAGAGGSDLGAYATLGNSPIQLTSPLQQDSNGYDISDNGTVVGLSFDDGYVGPAVAFAWSNANGMVALPVNRPQKYSRANVISADGNVIAGWNDDTDGFRQGVIWQNRVQMDVVDPDGNPLGEADGISANGKFVVGEAYYDPDTFSNTAWIWNAQTGIQRVPGMTYAFGVSNDGKTVVGNTGFFDNPPRAAMIWRQGIGTETVVQFLAEQGIAIPAGWDPTLSGGFGGLSGNGLMMAGWGLGPQGVQSYIIKVQCSGPSFSNQSSCLSAGVAPAKPKK